MILGGGSTFFFFTEDSVYIQKLAEFQNKNDFKVKQSPLCHCSAAKIKDTEVYQILIDCII